MHTSSCTPTQGVSDEPVLSKLSATTTSRDFVSPPNHFPKRVPYQLPAASSPSPSSAAPPKRGKGRDSSKDTKPVPHRSSIVVEAANQPYGSPLPPSSSSSSGVPRLPAIPRPFVPRGRAEYAHLPMMHQRAADGKIFGGATRRYVPAEYVPYQDPGAAAAAGAGGGYDTEYGTYQGETEGETEGEQQEVVEVVVADDEPVGPENPMKALSDTWSACWDDEAGAVYYYNQISGEATWVLPDDLGATTAY
jgi:hypothetical protein